MSSFKGLSIFRNPFRNIHKTSDNFKVGKELVDERVGWSPVARTRIEFYKIRLTGSEVITGDKSAYQNTERCSQPRLKVFVVILQPRRNQSVPTTMARKRENIYNPIKRNESHPTLRVDNRLNRMSIFRAFLYVIEKNTSIRRKRNKTENLSSKAKVQVRLGNLFSSERSQIQDSVSGRISFSNESSISECVSLNYLTASEIFKRAII